MFKKVSADLNFVEREKETEQFWKENHIFEKSMDSRREGPNYMFYDGPPTANGKPHIGHVLTRTCLLYTSISRNRELFSET